MELTEPGLRVKNAEKMQQSKRASGEEMRPAVSVIMPVYNGEKYIARAVQSVYAQDVPLELIVIDDGSADGTREVLIPWENRPDFVYIKNERNLGAAGSRNRGVSVAKGRYVAFLDADDWWEEDKLKKQLEVLCRTGAVLCCTGRELVTPDGKQTGRIIGVKEKITYRMMLHQNWINCSSAVMKTEIAKEFPMEHEEGHEDYILWLKILKKYGWAAGVNEPLLKYRLTAKGKSGNKLHSAKMTYDSYRYAGLGRLKSALCFCAYAANGVKKYTAAYLQTFWLQGPGRCDRIAKN